ncbi:MAG: acyl-CoA dehydrogenase family protein [Pseudomonadota bacterium]|jgi:alkylation response protein AidB-like acyl-CoA dehydrogenase|nr:acyl-CoA dehydrogenase family protein [Pseudomonadota bacterium]
MVLGQDFSDIRAAVSRICEDYPGEYWRELDAARGYPVAFVKALTESGFLGCLIPEAYGGTGLSLRAAAVILETIHAAGCSAAACHAQMYTMGTVLRHGSEAQKQAYLPAIAKGELRLQAFGVTEPTSGTDTTRLRTRAVREGDHYRVNGQKIWTSRALHSDLMLLLARTSAREDVEKPSQGLSVFLIDLRELKGNGIEIRPIDTMINHNTTEVFFDQALIPADTLIGEEGRGFRYILDGMNAERILIAGESIGDARYFLRRASDYAREREVFGAPIGINQGIQFPLARAYAETEAAELVARKAAALFEAGESCGAEANMAKLLCAEAAWNAGEACMQTFGGFAFAREYDIERKWREARLYLTAPVSTNLVLAYIAQHVLGLPKSY